MNDEEGKWNPRIIVAILIIFAYIILTAFLYFTTVEADSANERLLIQQLGALGAALGMVVVSLFPQRAESDARTINKLIDNSGTGTTVNAAPPSDININGGKVDMAPGSATRAASEPPAASGSPSASTALPGAPGAASMPSSIPGVDD